MSKYKLTYFDMRARGEIVRLVFAAAGVQYEDNRVAMDQWPTLKPSQFCFREFDYCPSARRIPSNILASRSNQLVGLDSCFDFTAICRVSQTAV